MNPQHRDPFRNYLLTVLMLSIGIGALFVASCRKQETPIASAADDEHDSIEAELDAAMGPADGLVGSGATDLRAEYAASYKRARKLKLAEIDHCEACGRTSQQLAKLNAHLECHHVLSVKRIFAEGLDPKLIGDTANLVVLCRNGAGGTGPNDHIQIGHLGRTTESNPNVRADAAKMLAKTRMAP